MPLPDIAAPLLRGRPCRAAFLVPGLLAATMLAACGGLPSQAASGDAAQTVQTAPPSTGGVPAGTGLTNPTLAFNLNTISDWSTEMPFLDLMHSMRPWIGHQGNTWSAMSAGQLRRGGYLDAHGWLKRMPPGLTAVGTIWDWGDAVPGAAKARAGTYVLTYRGKGTILMTLGAHAVSAKPGRIVFENRTGGTMGLNIVATDPSDYIRDIRVVPQRYEGLAETGELFNPDWLKVVQDARQLRFMDWMETNGSTLSDWADRPKPGDATWANEGVPVEVMVQLANQVGADPWFTMPPRASDSYIRQFATYVRDHLDPQLVAHVEYSNENWNFAFPQTHWLRDQARARWGTSDGSAWINYAAKRATETALIWDRVFGKQAKRRVDNVLGVQSANAWLAQEELSAPLWRRYEPRNYVAPASVFDSIAGTTYFGSAILSDKRLRARLLQEIATSRSGASSWLTKALTDPDVSQSIPQVEGQWRKLKQLAARNGLKLIAYEGGQHVQQSFGLDGMSKEQTATLTRFLTGYIRSPAMARLYQQLWNGWAKVGDGPFMQFNDVSAPSKWGSWGLLDSLRDSNPRADLLTSLNRSAKAWFGDGGGRRYQQGVIRVAGNGGATLTGTDKQDFLVGGTGNDTFAPGKGADRINGGPGTDTVVLPGKPDQYRLRADGDAVRLTGPGVSDVLIGIETLRFDGGATRQVADLLKG